MRKIKQTERPFILRYIVGEKCLMDSAQTLEGAKARAAVRLSKRKLERVEIFLRGKLVHCLGRG